MGVPMAIGLGPALGLVEDGIDLILADGTLMIAPSQDVMAATRADADARTARRKAAEARAHARAVTIAGIGIEEIGRAHVELQSLMRTSYAVFCLKQNIYLFL